MASTDGREKMAHVEHEDRRTGRADTLRGWFEGSEFLLPLRVYYEDTDALGIVYYTNYLKFAERARTEMIRSLGFEHRRSLAETGAAFAVRSCAVDYLQPAHLDDEIVVRTRIDAVGGASLDMTQRVVLPREGDGDADLVAVTIRLACLDQSHRPTRMPADLRGAIAALVAT